MRNNTFTATFSRLTTEFSRQLSAKVCSIPIVSKTMKFQMGQIYSFHRRLTMKIVSNSIISSFNIFIIFFNLVKSVRCSFLDAGAGKNTKQESGMILPMLNL